MEIIDQGFSFLVSILEPIFFISIGDIPVIILWIIAGGLFCTLRMGLINIWGIKDALQILLEKPDQEGENGEVSHFQALATALSGTIGLGNIAGVAIAIQMGGVGTVFWMSLAGFLGMATKFVECTLGQKYRQINPDGTISGGPMYYLSQGLAELNLAKFGQILAIFFALTCIGASFGAGNMFQSNQSFAALVAVFPNLADYSAIFGTIMAFLVGLVILGGISRIAVVTSKLVPAMMILYFLGCFTVLGLKFMEIPAAISTILDQAFAPEAIEGGLIGSLVQGMRRSTFSNGAGLGAAAIAHATARTSQPVKEGMVALLEPFIDTVVVCNLTALVIIITGTYGDNYVRDMSGSELTAIAFQQVIPWFPWILVLVILLFALSTMITWCYYGEKCWEYLFGQERSLLFKIIFLLCIIVGAIVNLGAVVDFSDIMLLAMSIPNLIGCFLLSQKVVGDLKEYSSNN